MKKILIVVAHPKEDSFSFAISKRYKEVSEQKESNVKILEKIK